MVLNQCTPVVDIGGVRVYRLHMDNTHPIRAARQARRLSQQGLAQVLGITKATVSQWELGNKMPSPRMAILLQQKFPRLSLKKIYASAKTMEGSH